MQRLRALTSISARALEWTILTVARTCETTEAARTEVNKNTKVWVVPPARMKAEREHRVPLTPRCLEILEEMEKLGCDWIFPGGSLEGPLSNSAMAECLKGFDVDATVHGFRSTFRDWVGEATSFPDVIAEAALAHVTGDKTEQAYRRGDALERRRKMMGAWGALLPLRVKCNRLPKKKNGSRDCGRRVKSTFQINEKSAVNEDGYEAVICSACGHQHSQLGEIGTITDGRIVGGLRCAACGAALAQSVNIAPIVVTSEPPNTHPMFERLGPVLWNKFSTAFDSAQPLAEKRFNRLFLAYEIAISRDRSILGANEHVLLRKLATQLENGQWQQALDVITSMFGPLEPIAKITGRPVQNRTQRSLAAEQRALNSSKSWIETTRRSNPWLSSQ